jgi:two-component sensor histidine kinase
MATNATKYGALSNDCGHVELSWKVLDRLHLHWAEHSGPAIEQPSHGGFGTRLIREVLHGTGTSTHLSFPTTGAVLDLESPVTNLQPAN